MKNVRIKSNIGKNATADSTRCLLLFLHSARARNPIDFSLLFARSLAYTRVTDRTQTDMYARSKRVFGLWFSIRASVYIYIYALSCEWETGFFIPTKLFSSPLYSRSLPPLCAHSLFNQTRVYVNSRERLHNDVLILKEISTEAREFRAERYGCLY